MALEGVAGAGKTTSLAAIREAVDREGYNVEGFAPTSRAAQKLQEAGIESSTLQRHLARSDGDGEHHGKKRLYVLDESSLASTKQMNEFLHRLRENDRVLLVGDVRQHQAVEAGTPYQQLQEAGIQTARLYEIVRQKDSTLKEVVQLLARGDVRDAMEKLDTQGRVHEIVDRDQRLAEIAREYATKPEGTLVVSPDNKSRQEINQVIHQEMQTRGQVDLSERRMRTLVARQEITGADRQWAGQYEPGDVVRYMRGSKAHGIEPAQYACVEGVNDKDNRVTVRRGNGEQVSYDPRRLHGVTLYRETERSFSEGDRVRSESRAAHRQPRTRHYREDRREWQSETASRRRPNSRVQHQRKSASGLRICRHQPQQPGANRRPCASACGHRAGRGETRQSPPGICGPVPWPLRCTRLYERQNTSDRATLARRVAPASNRVKSGPHCGIKQGPKTERAIPSQFAEPSVERGLSMGR